MSPANNAVKKRTKVSSSTKKYSEQSKTISLKPRMTEKTYALSQAENVYVFEVAKSVNKVQIKDAVEAQFGVNVASVKTLVEKGKNKPSFRKRTRSVYGKRPDIKKAYVTLTEKDSIPVFAAIERAEEKEKKLAEKAAKEAKKKGVK